MNPQPAQTKPDMRIRLLKGLAVVGLLGYLVAPWLNALILDQNGKASDYPGWPLLFFGWLDVMSVADGKFNSVGWLANPLFVLGTATLLIGERKFAVISLSLACLLTFGTVLLKEVLINEAGHTAKVVAFDVGFWLWAGSIWLNWSVSLITWLLFPVIRRPAQIEG